MKKEENWTFANCHYVKVENVEPEDQSKLNVFVSAMDGKTRYGYLPHGEAVRLAKDVVFGTRQDGYITIKAGSWIKLLSAGNAGNYSRIAYGD